jgi:Iap family predicted aminopeptidase
VIRLAVLLAAAAAVAVAVFAVGDGDEPERRPPPRTAGGARAAPPAPAGPGVHLRALDRIAREHGGNRAAGTAGDRASVEYVAGRLRAAGYRVDLQDVRFPYFDERRAPRVTAGARRLRRGRDVLTLQYSGSADVSARLRPVRYGAADSGCARGDFAGLRRGEVALVRRGTCTLRAKARNAQRAGAAAVLIANPDGPPFAGTLQRPGLRIPALVVSRAAGAALATAGSARVAVQADSEVRTTRNVLAERGEGDRVVMAGGHLDSVAAGPGINDNGSGVAALLAAAERLADSAPAGAALRFGFWGAEELGLIGARRYVARLPARERRRIAVYLNLDMVGSPNAVPFVYDTDDRIERTLRRHVPRAEETDIGGASDHAAFARAGVPVGGLYTGSAERKTAAQRRRHGGTAGRALDPCYHRACDDLGNVDQAVLRTMTAALVAALPELARG